MSRTNDSTIPRAYTIPMPFRCHSGIMTPLWHYTTRKEGGMNEQWRPVVGYESFYDVSDAGRVRRRTRSGRVPPTHLISQKTNRRGYLVATLSREDHCRCFFVHRLVAAAFIGPCPDGYQVNHRNGRKADNSPANLEYVTPQENIQHATATKLMPSGERNGRARLTKQLVDVLRSEHRPGVHGAGYGALARKFGVHKSTVAYAVRGDSWSE